eukprot:scaffold236110_cov20-Tisochrysis_lutea.AAC.3
MQRPHAEARTAVKQGKVLQGRARTAVKQGKVLQGRAGTPVVARLDVTKTGSSSSTFSHHDIWFLIFDPGHLDPALLLHIITYACKVSILVYLVPALLLHAMRWLLSIDTGHLVPAFHLHAMTYGCSA